MSTEVEPLVVPTELEQKELSEAWHRRLRNLSEDVRKASRARPRSAMLVSAMKLERRSTDFFYSASLNNMKESDPQKKAEQHQYLQKAYRQG